MQGVSFDFDETSMSVFVELKEKLISTPTAVALDWELPFDLMCDESDYVVYGVLG